ncbi:MAG: MerR family transcriptional regulator [Methylococcaceae bacterium]|nr:MerR family transcriptional regulator [Methylococcaceae bacterium]
MKNYQIGTVAKQLNISIDTLRYYEKIDLLKPVNRNNAGIRLFDESDIARIQFIQRAKLMNFTLSEINNLLKMREHPQQMRDDVRKLTQQKLDIIERQITQLKVLHQELQSLVTACSCSKQGCAIIEEIEKTGKQYKL